MSDLRSMPSMQAIELLATVAETGSLGQAAVRHGISQPAASLRLRGLERSLGLVLLDRSPVGSTLTAEGVAVVDWAGPLLETARAFCRGVEALRASRHDRLRVAASLTVADHLVPAWLVALHTAMPGIAAALRVANSSTVAELVRTGDADLGFVESPAPPAGVRTRVVGGDELAVIVAPSHPWATRRRPVTPAELAATPLVVREVGSGTRDAFEHALAGYGERVVPALELGSTTAIKAAVAAGEAPGVLSRLAVANEVKSGQLVVVPIPELDLHRQFHAIWRTGRAPAGAAATLLALILRSTTAR